MTSLITVMSLSRYDVSGRFRIIDPFSLSQLRDSFPFYPHYLYIIVFRTLYIGFFFKSQDVY